MRIPLSLIVALVAFGMSITTLRAQEDAMACVRMTDDVAENICDRSVAFFFCHTNPSYGHACGFPKLTHLAGQPEYYFTSLWHLAPGETLEVPEFGHFIWAACPQIEGGFGHAVSSDGSTFHCKSLSQELADYKARHAVGLQRQTERLAARHRHKERMRKLSREIDDLTDRPRARPTPRVGRPECRARSGFTCSTN